MSNRIEIKRMSMEQFDESMALSQFAFQYKKSEEELERTKKQLQAEPSTRYAAYVNGQFAAQATVLDLETYIGGKRFAMGGVAGVATWPEYRRQGLVAKILVHSLEQMRSKGQTISFLHPFSFGFYRKFGYETYTEYKSYTIKTELLPPRTVFEGRVERYNGSYQGLNDIYEAYASRFNGSLVRSELWWTYRVSQRKAGQVAVYYDKNEQAQGYLIYEVTNKRLSVHELVYLNEGARGAIWSFIGQHDSMINEVALQAPSDDLLPYLLPNPRIQQEIVPYFMARIVDVEAFMSHYTFQEDLAEDGMIIELSDEYAPWNAGRFMLRIQADGLATLSRIENDSEVAIKLSIGTFTALLLGYLRPVSLLQLGRIEGDIQTVNRLQIRIPERTTFLPDFF